MVARSLASIALASLVGFVSACSAGSGDANATATDEEDVTYIDGFPANSYFQIDSAHPTAEEISLIMFSTPSTYWGERCVGDACDSVTSISGSYKRSKTRLYLYDANRVKIGTFSYTLHQGTLTLREIGSSDRYALDPMSESLCDSSGGAWADDDFGPHGFNCSCPGERDWSSSGCEPCASGDVCP